MATIKPLTPTFSQVEAPVVIGSGSLGTLRTLDLKLKRGAWLYIRVGRRVATLLTRPGYVMVRRTDNDALVHPFTAYDFVTQIAAAQSNTLSAGTSIGDGSITLTSATGFAIGDTICLHSDDTNANRVEFARVTNIATNTLTLERNLRVAHNNLDRVTSLADCYSVWLPGGDHYEIRCVNTSGQSLVFAIDAVTDEGDEIV
jgi:hypothetical protein